MRKALDTNVNVKAVASAIPAFNLSLLVLVLSVVLLIQGISGM